MNPQALFCSVRSLHFHRLAWAYVNACREHAAKANLGAFRRMFKVANEQARRSVIK